MIYCKSGGCTAKLGAGALSRILSGLEKSSDPHVLVGFDSHDDGAIYQINDRQAIISTLDFFPPMIEDPYIFGQVAATNALSDIYAMGGRPLTALNIVCFPNKLDLNELGKILEGGNAKVLEAGATLVGGHSIVDEDIKYGLSVTGIVDVDKILRNDTVREGDVLFLTKKLGTGIIMASRQVGDANPEAVKEALGSMTTLNNRLLDHIPFEWIHACTDVTGFGLYVHLDEMLHGQYTAVVDGKALPCFDDCRRCVDSFYLTAAAQNNRNYLGDRIRFEGGGFFEEEIGFDAQTSGGLLFSVSEEHAEQVQRLFPCWQVAKIIPKTDVSIIVR